MTDDLVITIVRNTRKYNCCILCECECSQSGGSGGAGSSGQTFCGCVELHRNEFTRSPADSEHHHINTGGDPEGKKRLFHHKPDQHVTLLQTEFCKEICFNLIWFHFLFRIMSIYLKSMTKLLAVLSMFNQR